MNFLPQTAWWTESFFGIESSEAFVLEIWGTQGDNMLANLAVDDIKISPGLCPGKKYSVYSSIYISLFSKPCFLSKTSFKGWPGRRISNFLCSGTPSQPTLSLACQLPVVRPLYWSELLVVSSWHLLLQSCPHVLSSQVILILKLITCPHHCRAPRFTRSTISQSTHNPYCSTCSKCLILASIACYTPPHAPPTQLSSPAHTCNYAVPLPPLWSIWQEMWG